MQDSLFPEDEHKTSHEDACGDQQPVQSEPNSKHGKRSQPKGKDVLPAELPPDIGELAASLSPLVHFGTSSWHFPGWKGLVWQDDHAEAKLSREGLQAYAQHPLLRCVSLDRAFYRPLTTLQYMRYAQQVPEHFRFIVKAPALVADALVRGENGQGRQLNEAFLNPQLAVETFIQPALEGLGDKAGVLVFQISPLPARWLQDMPGLMEHLAAMLTAVQQSLSAFPHHPIIAVEVRDPAFLRPIHAPLFLDVLRQHQATYCLGLHAKMPPVEDQLFMLRALWPGPAICRWNLHRKHGAYGYEAAKSLYAPFDRLQDPDEQTRAHLARVIQGTAAKGLPVFVTINNKAEGSAPLSVQALAQQVVASQ